MGGPGDRDCGLQPCRSYSLTQRSTQREDGVERRTAAEFLQAGSANIFEGAPQATASSSWGRSTDARARDRDAGVGEFLHDGAAFLRRAGVPGSVLAKKGDGLQLQLQDDGNDLVDREVVEGVGGQPQANAAGSIRNRGVAALSGPAALACGVRRSGRPMAARAAPFKTSRRLKERSERIGASLNRRPSRSISLRTVRLLPWRGRRHAVPRARIGSMNGMMRHPA